MADVDDQTKERPERPERPLASDNVQPSSQDSLADPTMAADTKKDTTGATKKGWRFWIILASLSIGGLLSAIEATVISTALSSIVAELDIGDNYPWVVNSFMLTSTASQPIYGQLANLYGRRWVTIGAFALLLLGSGVCGGANSGGMLIAGRAVQGIGGGGLNMLIELIICDLVPLRERPKFMGITFGLFAVGTSLGPFIGGALVNASSWRWVFYINLPIGGFTVVLFLLFFHVHYKKHSFRETLGRFDFIGSALVLASATSILFALTYAGARYPWSSWRIIVPLVLGLFGTAGFHAYEASPWVKEPLLPPRLFGNRTSAISFAATLMQAFLFIWVIYFLPVYFQAVLGASPSRSGVQMLPTVTAMIPFALVGAQFIERSGRYKPVHVVGLALMAVGIGTFSLLDADSSTGMWVGLQLLQIAGAGIVTTALLPAIQASLTDEDNASSAAAASYVRSYGAIWGVTIPAAVFNSQFDQRLDWIQDPSVRSLFSGGNAYELGNAAFISTIPEDVRPSVIRVFVASLRITWIVGAAISAAASLLTLFEKEVPLRTELDTEFGLKEGDNKEKSGMQDVEATAATAPNTTATTEPDTNDKPPKTSTNPPANGTTVGSPEP